jgi:hypothetical protein
MMQQVADQLNRVKDSIRRLTQDTPLQGTSVSLGESAGRDRLNFRTLTPGGDQLIDCYQGVLLDALEGWTDSSLDRRMYEASDIMLRRLLNRPAGVDPTGYEEEPVTASPDCFDLQADGQPPPRVSGCHTCQELHQEIQNRLLRLQATMRRGTSISRNRCRSSADEFIDLLSDHLHIQHELRMLHRTLAFHRQNHSLEQRCRRLAKADTR